MTSIHISSPSTGITAREAGRYQIVVSGAGIEPVPPVDIDIGDKAPDPLKITVIKA